MIGYYGGVSLPPGPLMLACSGSCQPVLVRPVPWPTSSRTEPNPIGSYLQDPEGRDGTGQRPGARDDNIWRSYLPLTFDIRT